MRILCGVLLALLVQGCSPEPGAEAPDPTWRNHTRFITESPQDLFSPRAVMAREEVFRWGFMDSGLRSNWQLRRGQVRWLRGEGVLQLQSSDGAAGLEVPLGLDAAEVNGFQVEILGELPRQIRLFWSGPGESFSMERSLAVAEQTARKDRVFRFDLTSLSGWRGRVERLQWSFSFDAGKGLQLKTFVGEKATVHEDRLASAVSRAWKLPLHGEVQNGFLALPGIPIERTLKIPEEARLHFAYAVPEGLRQSIRFRVLAASAAGQPEVIWARELRPGEAEARRWQEAKIDLASFAGEELRLLLETESPEPFDPLLGSPGWGNPVVLARDVGPRPPNVLLVSVDTLRADRLSLYGYSRPTSPHLKAWAESSAVVFEKAVAQSPWTLPSHTSLFTGLDALRHGVNHPSQVPNHLRTLAEVLRDAGYTTLGVTGGSYLHPRFGLAQGFDRYRSSEVPLQEELASNIATANEWLRAQAEAQPFFLFFHTYEVHSPYNAREPYFSELGTWDLPLEEYVITRSAGDGARYGFQTRQGFVRYSSNAEAPEKSLGIDELPLVTDLYDSSIAYTDEMLHGLFSTLRSLGLEEETLVILTSDHGEALGEHGLAGHSSLYDHNVLVPLVIALPGGQGAGGRVRQQVRSIDVLPTVLEALGLPPVQGIDGVSLLPFFEGEEAAVPSEATSYSSRNNYGLSLRVDGRFKYIFQNNPWPKQVEEELYNLAHDPEEVQNLAPGSSQLPNLRSRAKALLEGDVPALRLRFDNRSEGPLCSNFEGPGLGVSTVKTLTPEGTAPCQWQKPRALRCCVPAEESLSLLVENVVGEILSLEGWVGPRGEEGTSFLLRATREELMEPMGWSLASPGDFTAGSPTGSGLTVWWQGSLEETASGEPEIDEKLLQQLKALGYIE